MWVLFTGGSGKAEKYSVEYLLEQGHSVGLTSEELIKIYYQHVPLKTNDIPKSF